MFNRDIIIGVFTIDLNGLISTVAASTAAIVAIVGGLLFSRLLSLSSEKNGIIHRLKELQADLQIRREQSNEISEWLLWDDAKDFIRKHAKEIVIDEENFENIADPDKFPYRSSDELLPFIQELLEVRDDLDNIFEKDEDGTLPDNFDDFYKNVKLTYSDRRYYYEIVFNLIMSEIERNSSPFGVSIRDLRAASLPTLNYDEYKKQRSERDRLDGEIKNIEYQIEVQKKNLKAYGRPDGLWFGLLVIVYSCVVGVIWPVTLLPYPVNTYNDLLTKWVALGWFFSALLALFSYLAWSTYKLIYDTKHHHK